MDDDDLRLPERLTVGVADDLLGQLGPDGKTLYFVSNRNTTNQVFAQTMADGRARQLFDDGADVTWPRVSPDGSSLLYISFPRARLGAALRPELARRRRRAVASTTPRPRCRPSGLTRPHRARQPPIDPGGPARPRGDGRLDALGAPLLDRNITSPAVSPDGRWLVYVPVARDRGERGAGVRRARRAAPRSDAARRPPSPPAPIVAPSPGQTGQPVFARDGRSLYVVQFFTDTNHDGAVDASDHGVLFRVPISFTGGAPSVGRSRAAHRDVVELRVPGPVRRSADRDVLAGREPRRLLLAARRRGPRGVDDATAANAIETPTRASRSSSSPADASRARPPPPGAGARCSRLRWCTSSAKSSAPPSTTPSRSTRSATRRRRASRCRSWCSSSSGAPRAAASRAHRWRGSRPRRASGSTSCAPKRRRARWPRTSRTSRGARSSTRSATRRGPGAELEAVTRGRDTPAPVVEAYYQRGRRVLPPARRSRGARLRVPASSPTNAALRPTSSSATRAPRCARWSAGCLRRRRRSPRPRAAGATREEAELVFAIDLARAVLAIRDAHAPPAVSDALLALYARQTRPGSPRRARGRRRAAGRRRSTRTTCSTCWRRRDIHDVKRGTRERGERRATLPSGDPGRAYERAAAKRFDDARADFDAVAEQTGSFEAVVGRDRHAPQGWTRPPADIEAAYNKRGMPPALAHFAKAYLLARQLPKLDGEAAREGGRRAHRGARRLVVGAQGGAHRAGALRRAPARGVPADGGPRRPPRRPTSTTSSPSSSSSGNPRFRAMVLGELGLLHTDVGNYRIALGYLLDRDKLPYTDNSEGLDVLLSKAQALLHVGREAEAAATGRRGARDDRAQPGAGAATSCSRSTGPRSTTSPPGTSLARSRSTTRRSRCSTPRATLRRAEPVVARISRAAAAVGAGRRPRALADLDYVDGARATQGRRDAPLAARHRRARGPRLPPDRSGLRATPTGSSVAWPPKRRRSRAARDPRGAVRGDQPRRDRAGHDAGRGAARAQRGRAPRRGRRRRVARRRPGPRRRLRARGERASATGTSSTCSGWPPSSPSRWARGGRAARPGPPRRLDAASEGLATRREPALRAYERWFEKSPSRSSVHDGRASVHSAK